MIKDGGADQTREARASVFVIVVSTAHRPDEPELMERLAGVAWPLAIDGSIVIARSPRNNFSLLPQRAATREFRGKRATARHLQ